VQDRPRLTYSAPGEAILGACPKSPFNRPGCDPKTQTIRRYGTSTSAPIAAGIAALFIDYTWQFMDGQGVKENARGLAAVWPPWSGAPGAPDVKTAP
jgi:hypothetical protein